MRHDISVAYVRKLAKKANNGNVEAQSELWSLTDFYRRYVNNKIESLERNKYDYGNAYNLVEDFVKTEYKADRVRFKYASDFKGDWLDMALQTQVGIRFRSYADHTVTGQRLIEQKKLESLRNLKIDEGTSSERYMIGPDVSTRTLKKFLRFLGREESAEIVDEYGNSEKIIEQMFDAYQKAGNSTEKMERAFNEYLASRGSERPMAYDEMLERIGAHL